MARIAIINSVNNASSINKSSIPDIKIGYNINCTSSNFKSTISLVKVFVLLVVVILRIFVVSEELSLLLVILLITIVVLFALFITK